MLHDNDIKPEEIIYNGDLKKKNLEGFAKRFDKTKR
jgi:nitrate reductase NapD